MEVYVKDDNWGRLVWSVPDAWNGKSVWWLLPSSHVEKATMRLRWEDRTVSDHGAPDRCRTRVWYIELEDGTLVPCERRAQTVLERT